MSRCDLDLRVLDLESLWYIVCHVVTVCSKSEPNRTISKVKGLKVKVTSGHNVSAAKTAISQ